MSRILAKKAVEMLLKGATLASEPCPYCKGVRVMKDGYALCVSCGREPEKKTKPETKAKSKPSQVPSATPVTNSSSALETLEKKLKALTKELDGEADHKKQQEILKSINSLVEIIEKMKNK
ncbi:MAG: Sjogren's syndrome/scleroderma autoantigen 1 family protein [Nitrosopumilaceae archaeon]